MARTSAIRTRVACAFVAILSLIALSFAAPIAHAAEGNIDPNTKGSMTIHKFANPDSGQTGDGTDLGEKKPTTEPVAGVKFTVARVKGVDLTTTAGWEAAKKVDPTKVETENPQVSEPTNEQGDTTVNNLSVGLYLVTETEAPAFVTTKAAPFLVTIPFPNKDKTWLYNVHVYPKNTIVTKDEIPVKVIKDDAKIHFPGDTIVWTINQKIPALAPGEKLTKFEIVDLLPKGVDKIKTSSVKVTSGDNAQPTITVSENNEVKVAFEGNELNKLSSGKSMTVEITATVAQDIAGELSNQSSTTINDQVFKSVDDPKNADPKKPENGNPTVIAFAPLTINKVNSQKQALDGAKFDVWAAASDGTCKAKPTGEGVKHLETKSGAGDTRGTTTLQVKEGDYCVQETEAPVGYEISSDYKDGKLVKIAKGSAPIEILNLKVNEAGTNGLLNLPLTGAAGMVVMTLLGAALIAAAFGFGFVALRRNKD
ncbi:SpaH/EbpB family LPXTG-anchored major pilin [Arcanobacterium canis]